MQTDQEAQMSNLIDLDKPKWRNPLSKTIKGLNGFLTDFRRKSNGY